jgi:trehalose-phosphatase
VSGRAVDEVKRLLGLETPIEIWGNHGLQRLRPDSGETETFDLPGEARDGIEAARDAARELDVGDRVEQKPGSVAVHVRGLASDKAKALLEKTREQWEPIVERFDDVEIHAFDGGLEFRSSAIDKGYAIRAILDELPSPDTPIAYLGDDRTDEDAFDALGERGLKVLVRQECRPTAADVWLQPPEELLQLLDRWAGSAESSIHESKGSP